MHGHLTTRVAALLAPTGANDDRPSAHPSSMPPIPCCHEECVRKSRLRARALIMLASLGEAYAAQLAAACGTTPTRVKWLMLGHPPQYSVERSLVGRGLARVELRRGRSVYVIAGAGLRKARSLTRRQMGRRPRLDIGTAGSLRP